MALQFFLFLAVYFFLLLGVGLIFSKKMRNLEDFFLASRNLSSMWVFFSLVASWIGATSTLVSVNEAYRAGVISFWVVGIPAVLTVMVFALFLARPIRRFAILTLPDLVEIRYGRTVRHLASVLIVWYMVLLGASQMVALGHFLGAFLDTSYFLSLLLGTTVVVVYSAFGGFRSVVLTDGLQFVLLVAGIFGLFVFLLSTTPPSKVFQVAQESGRLDYFNFFADFKRSSLICLSFTLAWLISPIAWQRIQAAATVRKARRGLWASAVMFFFFYGMVIAVGMFALPLISQKNTEGSILSVIISSKAGFVLGGILFVGVTAAIMSTMDTAINTGAFSLTHDIYTQLFRPPQAQRVLLASRVSTMCVAVLAFLVATRFQSILKTLGLASEIMAEGLFIPGMAMIFLKRTCPSAGFLSLVLGGGYAVIGFLCEANVLAISWPSWPFSVPYGVAISGVGFLVGILIDTCIKHD